MKGGTWARTLSGREGHGSSVTEDVTETFPRYNGGSQGQASLAGHPLQPGPFSPPLPAMCPTHLLREGSAKLTCSATFVLGGLKQGPALSESYLILAHTQHHCSQKEIQCLPAYAQVTHVSVSNTCLHAPVTQT